MEDLETFSGVLGLDQGLASVLKNLNWTTTRIATLVDAESLVVDWVISGAREQEPAQRLSREALVDMIHAAHTWAEMAWKVEGSTNGSELLVQSAISRAQRKMNEMREVRRQDVLAAVPRKGTAARTKWPTRLEKLKADAGCDIDLRERAEKKERDRWVASLRGILVEAKAPVTYGMEGESEALATRRFGKGRRAGTLRKHVKTWLRYRVWLRSTFQVEWPSEPFHFSSYLEARAAEPCGKSIPASLLKTLIFMEHAAEIVKSEQVSATPAVRNTLEEVKLELESVDSKPSRQAMHLPVALVMALEKAVMDLRFPRFLRGYAWFRLVKLWGCLRFNDTVGLDFGSITLESFGLQGDLKKTKTSGPGKKISVLKVFISDKAYVHECDWLETGWQLWKEMAVERDMSRRDFFLTHPAPGLESMTCRMASYAAASAMSHALASELLVYFENAELKLFAEGVSVCWTEHSERVTLRSWARVAGVPEDTCKRLGRWTPTVDQSYDRSVRTSILKAQSCISKFIRKNMGREDPFDECLIMQKISDVMEGFDFPMGAIQQQIEKLTSFLPAGRKAKRAKWSEYKDEFDFSSEEEVESFELVGSQLVEDDSADEEFKEAADGLELAPFGTYVVSIVGRSEKKTLHRMGECHRRPGCHFQRFAIFGSEPPDKSEYHHACRVCFPRGMNQAEMSSEEDSSSGDASSSGVRSEENVV